MGALSPDYGIRYSSICLLEILYHSQADRNIATVHILIIVCWLKHWYRLAFKVFPFTQALSAKQAGVWAMWLGVDYCVASPETQTNLWYNTDLDHCKQSSPVWSSMYHQRNFCRDVLPPEKSTLSQLATTDHFQQSSSPTNERFHWSMKSQSKWNTKTCIYSCHSSHTTIIHFTGEVS